ncbi:stalk domain-containing protein [Paenibacillus agricola]|uniref:VWA domain-containing protein n=1 Tax=Paenibacillus agricola TaxID=2716264 RepID=A0ABX0JG22_9BACL|nr:stalk domain-containing protein [Paenibacillus agricola]NHN34731.1 VWA domain-containing protein [Paenibacillus agricola]
MKLNKFLCTTLIAATFVGTGGSAIGSNIAYAETGTLVSNSVESLSTDHILNILKDGDGTTTKFKYDTKHVIEPGTIRVFVNAIETKEFDVDYKNRIIFFPKAPDIGSEIHLEYPISDFIDPSNDPSSSPGTITVSEAGTISINITPKTTYKTLTYYLIILNSDQKQIKKLTLNAQNPVVSSSTLNSLPSGTYTMYIQMVSGQTTLNSKAISWTPPTQSTEATPISTATFPGSVSVSSTGTISITIRVTSSDASQYYLVVKNVNGDIINTLPVDPQNPKISLNYSSVPAGTYTLLLKQVNGTSTIYSNPTTWKVPAKPTETTSTDSNASTFKFQLLSGSKFPGSVTTKSDGTFTINITTRTIPPTSTFYLVVKNTQNSVIKRIVFNPAKPYTNSWTNLKLTTGGYYYYIKVVSESGDFATSEPQFLPINTNGASIPQVFISGQSQIYEQAPINQNGNMLVPLRAIFEALGATVSWDQNTQTVTATKGTIMIVLTIGSKTATVNGKTVILNVPGQLINGYTMVPIRFVSESLGANVKWDSTSSSVVITTDDNNGQPPVDADASIPSPEQVTQPGAPDTSPILTNISKDIASPTDLVFVIDVTLSMTDEIDYVRETVKNFVDAMPQGSRFAVIAFRDINFKKTQDFQYFDFTSDKDVLKENIMGLTTASGGITDEESGLEAIHMAVDKLTGSSNAKRVIFITDAPVHDKNMEPGTTIYSIADLNSELQSNQVTLDAIGPSSGKGYDQIKPLVDDNKGNYFNIEDANINLLTQ